jgi:hypothetical protein
MNAIIPELAALSQGHPVEEVMEELTDRVEFEVLNDLGVDKKTRLTEHGVNQFNASLAGRYEAIIEAMMLSIKHLNQKQ